MLNSSLFVHASPSGIFPEQRCEVVLVLKISQSCLKCLIPKEMIHQENMMSMFNCV